MTTTVPLKNNILPNTLGLIVCGGNSSRMGTDKSMLQYYEKPQRYHVYDMLLPLCEHVFISINEQQMMTVEAGYDYIIDDLSLNNIGPMAALLTAFIRYPQMNMLLIGCDYPFLTATDLRQFAAHCTGENNVAAFYNEQEDMYEPLLAWYPCQSFNELKKMHEANQYSLQLFLKKNKAAKFYPADKNSITSVDTKEAFIKASNSINSA